MGSMLGSGVISNDWQYYDENEGLLWTIDFRFYCSACTGIEVASHDPLCNYNDVLPPCEPPQIYFLFLSRNLYARSKSLEESVMDVDVYRLQEVVDKGPWLICRDDEATYAITVGTRGHKIVGDIVFLMPCFLNFL